MTILELRQPLWMRTPLGEALALFLTDYGPESDHLWTCVQQDSPFTGELWTWHNSEIKMLANRSLLRVGDVLTINRNPGGFSVPNNMQTPNKIPRKSAKLMMRNKAAKAKSPKRKAGKATRRP